MNGTVTVGTTVTGIEADDFEQAKQKVKGLKNIDLFEVTETDENLSIALKEHNPAMGYFSCGQIKNIPLKVL